MDKIKEQFIEVIKHSQGIENPKVEKIFEDWYRNKAFFIAALDKDNKDFILELGEMTFEFDEEHKEAALDSFFDVLYMYKDLYEFVEYCKESFYDNIVNKTYITKTGLEIKKGSKIIRAFKHFIKDEELLRNLQDRASRLIQENSVTGTLCLSVNPLDFLSVSENAANWRSCHALDGEFRSGGLSYMLDKSTIIAYLRTDEKVKLPHFPESVPWNNKLWRCMIHFSSDFNMMMAGRQYPYSLGTSVLEAITHSAFIGEIFGRYDDWDNEYMGNCYVQNARGRSKWVNPRYLVVNQRFMSLEDLIKSGQGALNYNDLLESSTYTRPYYTMRIEQAWWTSDEFTDLTGYNTKFIIGAGFNCLACGLNSVNDSESMTCYDCYQQINDVYRWYCDYCSTGLRDEDFMATVGGNILCENCYEVETAPCSKCNTRILFQRDSCLHPPLCVRCAIPQSDLDFEDTLPF